MRKEGGESRPPWGMGMSDTRTLLAKIGALRQRLEQAQCLVGEARTAAAALAEGPPTILPFDKSVKLAAEVDDELAAAVRPITELRPPDGPRLLTSRARKVLEKGGGLLGELRGLAGDFEPPAHDGPDESAPLRSLYQDTVAMIDTAIRTVSLLPDSAAAQMHLCRGLEVTLGEVAERLRTLAAGGGRLRRQSDQVRALAGLLSDLETGQPLGSEALRSLVADVLAEAEACEPLAFLQAPPDDLAAAVACHSLTVARVMARLAPHHTHLKGRVAEAVLAALVHDVGMLSVPQGVLATPDPLDDAGRRAVEAHTVAGKQHLAGALRNTPHLLEAIACHHERQDGTGYPDGLRGDHIPALARMLAVCDTYAAMCVPRPHRPARSTRTALADTLLLAEQGHLDRDCAGLLLKLSFYPVGSVVEMSSGAVGVVVAAGDAASPARPVVAVLTDDEGEALAWPRHLDLTVSESNSIVRPLSVGEKLDVLGRRLARWAA